MLRIVRFDDPLARSRTRPRRRRCIRCRATFSRLRGRASRAFGRRGRAFGGRGCFHRMHAGQRDCLADECWRGFHLNIIVVVQREIHLTGPRCVIEAPAWCVITRRRIERPRDVAKASVDSDPVTLVFARLRRRGRTRR